MRTLRRTALAERVLSPQQFERMLQRAEKFQRLHGPHPLAKPRSPHKRAASAA